MRVKSIIMISLLSPWSTRPRPCICQPRSSASSTSYIIWYIYSSNESVSCNSPCVIVATTPCLAFVVNNIDPRVSLTVSFFVFGIVAGAVVFTRHFTPTMNFFFSFRLPTFLPPLLTPR
ncbi:hypothetical protein F4823DRAFT_109836 [Ustulina deusta]|nr:hypothetical protein F4823DRAFT_109836 [Ustulina deusta]